MKLWSFQCQMHKSDVFSDRCNLIVKFCLLQRSLMASLIRLNRDCSKAKTQCMQRAHRKNFTANQVKKILWDKALKE